MSGSHRAADPEPTQGTLGASAARGASITMGAQGGRLILRVVSTIVLARLLMPEDFGLVAMVTAIIGVAEIIRDFGLSSAALHDSGLTQGQRTNLFWANLSIGAGCALVTSAAAPLIASLYGDSRLIGIVLALGWLFIVSGGNTQFRVELSHKMRFSALALTDTIAQVASVAIAVALALVGCGYWAIVAQQIVLVVVTCVMNVMQCRWRPGWPCRDAPIGVLVRYGRNVAATNLIGYGVNNVDNVAIGIVWGAVPLGLYSRAYQLLLVPLEQINAPLSSVALPILARVRDDRIRLNRYLERAQLLGCYFFGVLFAIAAGLATPIIAILFGEGWNGVAPIFAILAIGGIFRGYTQLTYWIYLTMGRTGSQLRLYLVTRPIMAAMMLAGLPWGPVGVAIGHSAAFLLYWLVSTWHVQRATGVDTRPLFLRAARSVLLLSAPLGLLSYAATLIVNRPWLQVLVALTACATYLALTALLLRGVRTDLKFAVRSMRSGLRRLESGAIETEVRAAVTVDGGVGEVLELAEEDPVSLWNEVTANDSVVSPNRPDPTPRSDSAESGAAQR